jgi:predicted DsbA family dithiol-disulfide isomerase
LYWAGHEHGLASQHRLKKEFFNTYFCLAVDFDKRENLLEAVQRAHLDQSAASKVLEEGLFAKEVRVQLAYYQAQGINAVPNLILNGKYSLQGAQPLEILEAALKEVIEESS